MTSSACDSFGGPSISTHHDLHLRIVFPSCFIHIFSAISLPLYHFSPISLSLALTRTLNSIFLVFLSLLLVGFF